jgi:hypothetical protein
MEGREKADLARLDEAFDNLKAADTIEIFNLTQEMLERCADLSYLKLDLQPFDQAILAAILVRGEQLLAEGEDETAFCELDSHLQPWNKDRNPKELLAGLYDRARIWVYEDFLLQAPAKPGDWVRTAGNNP